jgi:hypothetical protein
MRYDFQTAQGLILLVALTASVGPVQASQQTFKDEGGRVIYTIDEDGTVTMYEKSPGDQTISVSTGTREQMQPQVTEISPEKVTSGSFVILKITGKNLVGAKASFSTSGIEVNPYTSKPDSLALPIRVPAMIPAGEVVIELTTPIGTAKTSFKVADLQLGGFGSSRREQQAFTTAAPPRCPDGMLGVAYDLGGFCIDIDRTLMGDYKKAERACAIASRRLCQASEWQQACEQAISGKLALKNITGEWEWTGSWESIESPVETMMPKSVVVGKTDCQTRQAIDAGNAQSFPGRCCK